MTATSTRQVDPHRPTPSWARVVLNNLPVNVMGPDFVVHMGEVLTGLESDDRVKVIVDGSAVDGFFPNHSDFTADVADLTDIPQGPPGLEAWPHILARLTGHRSSRSL